MNDLLIRHYDCLYHQTFVVGCPMCDKDWENQNQDDAQLTNCSDQIGTNQNE